MTYIQAMYGQWVVVCCIMLQSLPLFMWRRPTYRLCYGGLSLWGGDPRKRALYFRNSTREPCKRALRFRKRAVYFHKTRSLPPAADNVLHNTATHCNTGVEPATRGSLAVAVKLIHTATPCNTLQHTATHTATHRNIRQHRCWACNLWISHSCSRAETHCNTLQHTATHCNTHCNALQHTATQVLSPQLVDLSQLKQSWHTLQHTATPCNTLQHTLQRTATHCNTGVEPATRGSLAVAAELTHTATHCNTLQHTLQRTATHGNTGVEPTTCGSLAVAATVLVGMPQSSASGDSNLQKFWIPYTLNPKPQTLTPKPHCVGLDAPIICVRWFYNTEILKFLHPRP